MKKLFGRSEKAQTTAEFVIVLPVLLLLFFLIIDFGWLFKNWIVVTNTARETARCTIANACASAPIDLAKQRITDGITGNLEVDIPPTGVVIRFVDLDNNNAPTDGDTLIVCIRADNSYIGPVLPLFSMVTGNALADPLPLVARSVMVIELPLDAAWVAWGITEAEDDSCNFSVS